jgi:hypothetical protein
MALTNPTYEEGYFEKRLSALGISAESNQVNIWQTGEGLQDVLKPFPVFRESEKFTGGIDILVYTLARDTVKSTENSRWRKDYVITRLNPPITRKDGSTQKYHIPKGQGTYPFFHPWLIELFENKQTIETLYLTEGFFKAWKGCMHGIPVVGLTSITHMKDKEKGTLHPDILKLMIACNVKRMVWLTDGDCLDITSKDLTDGVDLYKRPRNFFSSCGEFKRLLDDYVDIEKWFVHIDIDNILQMHLSPPSGGGLGGITRDQVKGLDDLLVTFGDRIDDIVQDIKSVSKPGDYFQKFNITYGLAKVHKHFHLTTVDDFYLFHVERRKELKNVEFKFNGTSYRYDEEHNVCKIVVPGEAKSYFRVGDQYHKFVYIPNKYAQLERTFHRRQRSTIVEDHGKEFPKHIPKYEAFCSVPDHINFQQVISNCFNMYSPFEHEPLQEPCTEEDCPNIIGFIKHIFGTGAVSYMNPKLKVRQTFNQYDLGLDYIQLLYKNPTQKLPILCLVSRENETGKSTFAMLLKLIFTGNVAIVGNAELSDNFNASWASKKLIICDEAKIDKQVVVEKVKSLSMGDKIMMNAKGKDHIEIDFYGCFMFLTNNEENFIYASEEDLRFWIIKVHRIKDKNPDLLFNMQEEIPAFLSFLDKRKMVTDRVTRMWFDPALLRTEALQKVIQHSQPTIEKELRQYFRDAFKDFGVDQIMMTLQAVHEEVFRGKYERNYLEKVLKEHIKADQFHKFLYNERKYDSWALAENIAVMEQPGISDLELLRSIKKQYQTCRHDYPKWERKHENGQPGERVRVDVKDNGRPYVFKREMFLTQEEIESVAIDPQFEQMNTASVNQADIQFPERNQPDDLPF